MYSDIYTLLFSLLIGNKVSNCAANRTESSKSAEKFGGEHKVACSTNDFLSRTGCRTYSDYMATKRKAYEAFGKPNGALWDLKCWSRNGADVLSGQLSAVAAAKLAKQSKLSVPQPQHPEETEIGSNADNLEDATAASIAATPYDGERSEASTSSAENYLRTKPAPTTRLSSFCPRATNVIRDDEQCLEVKLRPDETITVAGEYDLHVVQGLVKVYGAVLRPQSGVQRLYAPSTHALPQIVAHKDAATVRISSVRSSIRKLERLSPLWRNVWTTDAKGRSFALLQTVADDPLQRTLNTIETDKTAESLLSRLVAKAELDGNELRPMIIGPKSSGKSTFCRVLCNALLTRTPADTCYILDIDPGQPEFGPPGQLSLVKVSAPLLGPAFTHIASSSSKSCELIAAQTVAATTFKDDPAHYLACVSQLLRVHTSSRLVANGGNAPLIINTCGWLSGIGADTLANLHASLQIKDTVILGDVEEGLVRQFQRSGDACHRIPRCPPRPSSRTPAELRAMQMMAYFHQKPTVTDRLARWSSKAISSVRPWNVRYGRQGKGIHAIVSYGQEVKPEFLAEVLDGSIAAIVVFDKRSELLPAQASTSTLNVIMQERFEDGSEIEDGAQHDERVSPELIPRVSHSPEGLPCILGDSSNQVWPLDPASFRCIGLALVRGIEAEQRTLLLVTPLSESQIASLDDQHVVLVRGGYDPPDWAYLEDLYRNDGGGQASDMLDVAQRPWVSREEMVGIEGAVWRLRHPPLASQMTSNR